MRDAFDGSVVKGLGKPIIHSFVLVKTTRYKVFCWLENLHFKKLNKSVSNNITAYLEDDDHKELNFNGETLPFTLQLVRFEIFYTFLRIV